MRSAEGFRHVLRSATAEAHEVTESRFAFFTDRFEERWRGFLAAQKAALAGLLAAIDAEHPPRSESLIRELLDRLVGDLGQAEEDANELTGSAPMDPLAIDYLVIGSRLGTETLRRQLLQRMPINKIPLFLQPADTAALWKEHCALLDGVQPGSGRAATIVEQARRGFELFGRAASDARNAYGS